jgi:hypothetical protein
MPNYYNATSNEVGLSNLHPNTIYHEFGHVADLNSGKWKKPWYRVNNYLDRGLKYAVPAAIIGGQAIADSIPGTVDDKIIGALANYGPEAWLAARATGPLMAEYNANIWANKQLADIGSKNTWGVEGPDASKVYRNMRRANWLGFGKYVFNTAVPYGIFAAMRHVRNKELEKSGSVAGKVKGAADATTSWGKALFDDAMESFVYRPYRAGKAFYNSPGTVFSEFEGPTYESMKEMLMSDRLKDLALASIIPAAIGTAAIYGIDPAQQEALKGTDASKLPYYGLLRDSYVRPDIAPWIKEYIAEGLFI